MCKQDSIADLIPVDIVINLMIATAWRTATKKQMDITIYNCCTGGAVPVTWGRFVQLAIQNMRKHPLGELRLNFRGLIKSLTV